MKRLTRIPMLVTLASLVASAASLSVAPSMAWAQVQTSTSQAAADDGPLIRRQEVRSLPGGLDQVLIVNDNNPELIIGEGTVSYTHLTLPTT